MKMIKLMKRQKKFQFFEKKANSELKFNIRWNQ